MNVRVISAVCACFFLLGGCASKPSDIEASYVSTSGYERMSCNQLRDEAEAVSQSSKTANKQQEKKAGADAAAVAVGVVIFWPALFFTKGDGATAAEVSRLKGEMNAIEVTARRKKCDIRFMQAQ